MRNRDEQINEYLKKVIDTLSRIGRKNISEFTEMLLDVYNREGTIFIFGNGGSGATASHFSGDLIKGVSYNLDKKFKVICLNDNIPALMAIANDISFSDIFLEQLKNFVKKDDLVIGLSGSGNSMNVVKALDFAKKAGAKTAAFCGFDGGKIKGIADVSIQAEIDNMEVSEDIHLIIFHCVKSLLVEKLKKQPAI